MPGQKWEWRHPLARHKNDAATWLPLAPPAGAGNKLAPSPNWLADGSKDPIAAGDGAVERNGVCGRGGGEDDGTGASNPNACDRSAKKVMATDAAWDGVGGLLKCWATSSWTPRIDACGATLHLGRGRFALELGHRLEGLREHNQF
mgnify:CR=1 FL=1